MPLYHFICSDCTSLDKRILEPEQLAKVICRKCGGRVHRTGVRPPTAMLKEVVDNGLMVKRLENYVDGQRLTKERSVMDFTRPDWQKVEE